MTPKIKLNLAESGCRKPGCKRRFDGPIHRHHVRNDKWFLTLWKRFGPPEKDRSTLRYLNARYHSFRKQDVVNLCSWHHAEIHILYEARRALLIKETRTLYGSYMHDWKAAIYLMRKFKQICREWLKEDTPGINPRNLKMG